MRFSLTLSILLFIVLPLVADTLPNVTTYVYSEKEGEELFLDHYGPSDAQGKYLPTLIWMHGGGFAGGSRAGSDEVGLMEFAVEQNWNGISISYRYPQKGRGFGCDIPAEEKLKTFRMAAEDLWDAIVFVVHLADSLGVDTSAMVIGGSSAGAETALNAVYMKPWVAQNKKDLVEISPLAVLSLAGAVIDSRYINSRNSIPAVLLHGKKDNLVPYASAPHHYCSPQDPGYIILDGTAVIAKRLIELNTSCLLYSYENRNHDVSQVPLDKLPEIFDFFEFIRNSDEVMHKTIHFK